MDEQQELLREVFGESSDSEDSDQRLQQQDCDAVSVPVWEPIQGIDGLWLCRDFLSPKQQASLLTAILNEEWFTEASQNQAMRFGNLPPWATELSDSIRDAVILGDHISESKDLAVSDSSMEACVLPSILLCREPLFDQLIANAYQPGEGICAHVDLMRFEDGIAIVSLESSCVMHFSRVEEVCDIIEGSESHPSMMKMPVYLTPGSLILMSGPARYLWKHEINRKPGFQMWEGQELKQKRRISITLRKLCQVE